MYDKSRIEDDLDELESVRSNRQNVDEIKSSDNTPRIIEVQLQKHQ